MENETSGPVALPYELMRVDTYLAVIYCIVYGMVFIIGLIGNSFVVAAVFRHRSMRNITNYFITNLAIADMLIIVFCVPATLMNNIFNEWHFGALLCKLSIWLNSVATGASVFTLVAVTADRFVAIVYTMRYSVLSKTVAFFVILPAWVFSSVLYLPYLIFAKKLVWNGFENITFDDGSVLEVYRTAHVCQPVFPSPAVEQSLFVLVIAVAYVIPLIIITVCYSIIFAAIIKRAKLQLAVDQKAAAREHRIKLRVTVMMLLVIIVFACSWAPLYSLYFYMYFGDFDHKTSDGVLKYVRPIAQWLTVANSCVNPILYACFSMKYRDAFRKICLLPFARRYQLVRQATRRTWTQYSGRGNSNKEKSCKRLEKRSQIEEANEMLLNDAGPIRSQQRCRTSSAYLTVSPTTAAFRAKSSLNTAQPDTTNQRLPRCASEEQWNVDSSSLEGDAPSMMELLPMSTTIPTDTTNNGDIVTHATGRPTDL